MKSLALVLTYFGELPNYFDLWLESAKRNSTIDFLIFTDCEIRPQNNIKVYKCSLSDIKARACKVFGFQCKLESPYKLCDYKPACGLLFQKELQGYDYWGHIDPDIVMGDLRKFLTDELLEQYEKISNLGHLIVYKNTVEVNEKFMCMKSGMYYTYKEAFLTEENVAFDEKGGITWLSNEGYYKTYVDYQFVADIFPDTYHFRTFYNIKTDKRHIYQYHNGRLYALFADRNKINMVEMMYIHLQSRKMEMKTKNSNSFFILPNAFVENIDVNVEFILQVNEGDKENVISSRKSAPISLPFVFRLKRGVRRKIFLLLNRGEKR